MTACMWASLRGHTDVVQLFLFSGTQVDLQDKVSTTSIPASETTILVSSDVRKISFRILANKEMPRNV